MNLTHLLPWACFTIIFRRIKMLHIVLWKDLFPLHTPCLPSKTFQKPYEVEFLFLPTVFLQTEGSLEILDWKEDSIVAKMVWWERSNFCQLHLCFSLLYWPVVSETGYPQKARVSVDSAIPHGRISSNSQAENIEERTARKGLRN